MVQLKEYSYKLETISSLILSPREQNAFVCSEKEKIACGLKETCPPKIIYPFYQYGSYEHYEPQKAQYYIPGSSIKGAMQLGGKKNVLVDDILIDHSNIKLKRLCKVQHIPEVESDMKDRKAMKLEEFFPNIAVEMLKADKECLGKIYCNENIFEIIKRIKKYSNIKLEQLSKRIQIILSLSKEGYEKEEECREALEIMNKQLKSLIDSSNSKKNETILILGGYKGRLLSGEFDDKEKGSIYIDIYKKLPYGLVRMRLEEEK